MSVPYRGDWRVDVQKFLAERAMSQSADEKLAELVDYDRREVPATREERRFLLRLLSEEQKRREEADAAIYQRTESIARHLLTDIEIAARNRHHASRAALKPGGSEI